MMQKLSDSAIVNATPSVERTTTSGAKSAASSWTSSAAAGSTSSSADASATLQAAIAKYMHQRLTMCSSIDDAGADELQSSKNNGAGEKHACPSSSEAARRTPSQRAGDGSDNVNEAHLVTCTQQVEAHLLRCLLHVELTPGWLPSQPEVIGGALGIPSVTTTSGMAEGSRQVHRAAPRVATTTTNKTTSAEGEQSPPPRRASASAVGEKYCSVESTGAGGHSQRNPTAAASSSPRARASSGGAKAKELYYTYTHQGIPPSRPHWHGGSPAGIAPASSTRSPNCSSSGAASAEVVKGAQASTKRRRRANRDSAAAKSTAAGTTATLPPEPDISEGAPPTDSNGLSAFPYTRGGVVRPLHATEIRSALRSWPSRVAQYVLATTFAEQELRSAAASTDGVANVGAPAEHRACRSSAPASNAHKEGRASATEPSQAGDNDEVDEDEAGVVIDALVRRLYNVLQHTRLALDAGATGADKPAAVAFPSFARFYLTDDAPGNIAHDGGASEHVSHQRMGEDRDVHLYLARLTDVLLSTITPGVAGASYLAWKDEVSSIGGLGLSGDIATEIGALLKHTPLITVPNHPSASPASTLAVTTEDVDATAPLLTPRDAVWRALRSLLHLSPSSSHNSTMCTSPLVVGLVRRYTPVQPTTSNGGSGGDGDDGLRVRFLPAGDLLRTADVPTSAAAAPAPDDRQRDCQHAARDRIQTPAFYTAVLLEVTGRDVLHSTASHEDAVALEEESTSKVRYEADVPETYRDRHRRRCMMAQNHRGVHYSSSSSTHRDDALRSGRTDFGDNIGSSTALSSRDRCLSRRECALWETLLALAHFVHVSGTPAEVETTARYVTLAIRHRREARQQSQRDPRQVYSASATPVSVAESTALPSVPAFFFTLTETSALRSAAATDGVARPILFWNDLDDGDDHVEVPAEAVHGIQPKTGGAQPTATAAGRPSLFFGGSGLGLRALLGWGKGATTALPVQPTSPSSGAQDRCSSNSIRVPPQRDKGEHQVHASSAEQPSHTTLEESAEELIMDWMHDVLIPLFFETTLSGSFAPQRSSATPVKSPEGNEHGDSMDDGSAAAATARRRRASYHLRSQRVLLGRVQVVTPSMVYGGSITAKTASTAAASLVCDMEAVMEAVVHDSMFDAYLLSYLLLNQLFFAPDGSPADAAHDAFSSPTQRARSAPLPEWTSEHPRSAAAVQQRLQQDGSRSNGLRPIRASSTSAAAGSSPHSPNAQSRRVSFLEDASLSTPPRLATPLRSAESGAGSPQTQLSCTIVNGTSPDRSSSAVGSPRSILKSGRRYKRDKLIRSSAPATSVVPFRSLFLWRWLVAEVLGNDDGAHGASKQQQQQGPRNISAVSTTLCITSAAYMRHTRALAVRIASDVATAVLLAGLLAEQYACCRQLRDHDGKAHQDGSSAETEHDHGDTYCDAANIKEKYKREAPEAVNTEAAPWHALKYDDLLPLARSAALAFVRAALAPMLCCDNAAAAHFTGVSTEVHVGMDFSDAGNEDKYKREGCDDANSADDTDSEQSSTGATSYVDGHRGQHDVGKDGTTPRHERASAPPAISLLSPSLPADVLNRLQTLSVVCVLHVRQEVLESFTRSLDVVLRRLTLALARHRLRALCRPLDDALRRGNAAALLCGAGGNAPRVQVVRQFWQLARQVLSLYEECLVLPHLIADTGVPLLMAVPTAFAEEKSEEVASEAAVNGHNGDGKAHARAHKEESSGEREPISLLTTCQENAPTPSFAAGTRVKARTGVGIRKFRLSPEPQPPLVSSVWRNGVGFVPLSFGNASFDPAGPSTILPAQRTAPQVTPSRESRTCSHGGSNPHSASSNDPYNQHHSPFDGRAVRLASAGVRGAGSSSSSSSSVLEIAASDFMNAATSALGLQWTPPFASLRTHGTTSASQVRAPLGVNMRTDTTTSTPVGSNCFNESSGSGNGTNMVASSSRAYQLTPQRAIDAALALHRSCAGDASRGIDAASSVRLFHSPSIGLDVPVFTASDASESRHLAGSPLCAISSGSEAFQQRPQHGTVSPHGSSFLTLTFAVPLLRCLQTVVSSAGEGVEECAAQPRKSPQRTQQPSQWMPCEGHAPAMGTRESIDAAMGPTARAADESPLLPERDVDIASWGSKISVVRVIRVRSGVAVESPLLSPFVTEAKRLMVAALLQRWVLPWLTQLILVMEQEVAEEKRSNERDRAHAGGTTVTHRKAAPNSPTQRSIQRRHSLTPPTARSTIFTDPAANRGRVDKSAGADEAASSAAVSQWVRQITELTQENAVLHSRLHDTQRLLADIHQTLSGLRMAARQYEPVVALQRETTAAAAAAVTRAVTDSSVSLVGGGDTITPPQQLDFVSPSPLFSTPQVALGSDVEVGSPHDDATLEKVVRRDSVASPLESFSVTSPLPDGVSPQLLYFARTEEGRERVVELCQRMAMLLSGAADPEDTREENTASTPPSAIAQDGDLPSRLPSSTSALAKSHSSVLNSLSQGMQGSQCPSLPEPTSAELEATATVCGDYSARRRHSAVSHGPSQLFSPLVPQSFRRTSTAHTLMSFAPTAALAMSSTLAAETPCSTPIAVLIVGASSDFSTGSSPAPLSRQNSLQQQQYIPPLLPSSVQSAAPQQHTADPSLSGTDVGVLRKRVVTHSASAPSHVSPPPLGSGATSLQQKATLWNPGTQVTPPVLPPLEPVAALESSPSPTTLIAPSAQVQHTPPQRHGSSAGNVEAGAHMSDKQQHSTTSSKAAPSADSEDSHGTQEAMPYDDRRRLHGSPGENGDGNSDDRQATSSTLSSPSVHSSYSAQRASSAVELRGSAALSFSLPPPLSPPSPSTTSSGTSPKPPFEVHDGSCKDALVVTTATVHTSAPHTVFLCEKDADVQESAIADAVAAAAADTEAAGSDGSATEAPKGTEGDGVIVTAADEVRWLAKGASRVDPEGDLSEQPTGLPETGGVSDPQPLLGDTLLPLPRVLLIPPIPQLPYKQPTSKTLLRSRESPPLISLVTRRVTVRTQSSPISSPSPATLQCTDSEAATHGEPHVTASDDEVERASHESGGASCDGGALPVQHAITDDAGEVDGAVGPKLMWTKAETLQVRRCLLPTREDANGVASAPVSSAAEEQAAQHVTATATVSSSPWRERTPARNSEAAVTALADLQQRLSGSNSAVAELRQQLQQVEEELREKEAAMACLTEQLSATEAALGAARQATILAKEEAQQQQHRRLSAPSPTPPRVSVATSTVQVLLSASASSTPLCEERAKEVDRGSVACAPVVAMEETSRLTELTAATVEGAVGEPKAAAAPAMEAPVSTSPPSSAESPPSPRAQFLHRVHELEDELRNANFRMDQWHALLDAERHAHVVQMDQLTQQLQSEQRRRARASRSRSRSLSPLGNGTVSSLCLESSVRNEARGAQPLAPPPPLAFFPPPAAEMRQLNSSGEAALAPASLRENHEAQLQQHINTLAEQLHGAEVHAAEERTKRVAAEDVIRVLECEQRVLRERLEALENERAVAVAQQQRTELDAVQREEALRREFESHMQTLSIMQAAQAANKKLQLHLTGELDAERRARAAADVELSTLDRLVRDGEEAQQQLRCERDKALQREKEVRENAEAEAQAAQSRIATLQERIESTMDQLRAAEAESGEHRHRCMATETQAAALESARKALTDRVMMLEKELFTAHATQKQWQQDTEEHERALRQEYEETAANAGAAMEAQCRANKELHQRSEEELRVMQRAQAVSDEAHRTAFEEATRKLANAEQVAQLAMNNLRRERETHEITATALQKAELENEELHRCVSAVLGKQHLAELDAAEQRRQRDRIVELERELEAVHAQQQDRLEQQQESAKKREDALSQAVEAHVRTIAALQEGKSASDKLRQRLEEELQSEKLARAAETAAHKAVLAGVQDQVSRVEQRAQEGAGALRREERAHARLLAEMQTTDAHAQQRAQSWWSAHEACSLEWIEAKTLMMADAWSIKYAELQLQLHELQSQRRGARPQQTPSCVTPSPIAARSPPVKSERRKERRSGGREKHHDQSPALDPVDLVQAVSVAPRPQPEMVAVSVDDPLGLRYELQRKIRHIASLEERVRQLEEAHGADQQVVSALQKRVAQEEMRDRNGVAAASRLPPPPASLPTTAASWLSRSLPHTPSRRWSACDPTLVEGHNKSAALLWDPNTSSRSGAASPSSTMEGKRLTPNEYRQRYACI
ncbi:conserved hypothetical protein [Leishmania braziliensis MHOM/BR/75/M2904]|uniref:Uncharacterized protein n=1 Tax=Leishmania braziliensis TaxID=5660 RepID=A4H7N4_LEIBR|nr:conserved hypothetical protein [Leishmania braziliensis MHOM/BR/75/M2904]CAJ2469032.1 unnamed protein product [Leishmania braziliensis]CAM37546.2 conserved hypothetical protein [Leishmania braziliensis MHOM/BR/75/M2904]